MFSIHRNHLSDQGVDYVTFGRGDKTLVIITGLSLQGLSDMSDLAIYSLFYRYAKEYKVYIFDRKGHIEEGISIENMADDLYHSLQELHIAKASIIGISQGAENGEMAKLNKDSMCKTFSSPMLKKLYVINKLFLKTVSVEKQERFVRLAKSILEFDCHKSLDKITCPTLVLGAKKDLVLGVDGARELANSIPNASYYEFGKLGHAAFIESKQFNKMILEFLRENT